MAQKPEGKWNLYAASFFVAVMAALVGFGATLTNPSPHQSSTVAERAAPAGHAPGSARSSGVAQTEDSADRDGNVYMYY
jgi:hypothetical protein